MKYVFDSFIVDSCLFVITKNGEKQQVEPRIFELLVYFCEHPNTPISREQLIEHVWQQRIVGHAAINRAVSELRKLLESDPSEPQIITTVSKVGYQFNIAPEVFRQDKINEVNNHPGSSAKKKSTLQLWVLCFLILIVVSGAYIAKLDDKRELLTNAAERPITSLKGTAFKARLSANAQDLLFIHKENANSAAKVWLRRGNSSPQLISDDNYYYIFAIFGPANQIYASRFNDLHQRKCEIVSIDLTTGETRHVTDCADRALTSLAFNRARNTLYFNFRKDVNAPYSIYAYQVKTARLQQVTFPYGSGNARGDYMLSLSPQNDQLAVFEYQDNSMSLLKIVNLDNNSIVRHENEFEAPSSLSWLDQDHIVTSSTQGLMAYDVEDHAVQMLKAGSGIGYAAANPRTGRIVFDKGAIVANIYQYPINSEQAVPTGQAVTSSSFVNFRPKFANLTKKNAYISTDAGSYNIVIQPQSSERYSADFNRPIRNLVNFHWSPDDKHLVASINSQLYMFSEQDKQWQIVAAGLDNIHYVHFSDAQHVIFSSDHSGDWQIWSLNLQSGELTQITTAGGYSAQGNIENGYLYLTKFNHSGLYRLDLESGKEVKLIADFQITSWNKWQLVSDNIYYIARQGIDVYNVKSETTNTILPHGERAPSSFTVSFDQQYILREKIEQSNANIWQINTG